MVWQDNVIGVSNILFAYALIYQVYKGYKEKKGFLSIPTSLPTTVGLYAVAFAMLTLGLYFSSITAFFNGTMWFLLFFQRLFYKKV